MANAREASTDQSRSVSTPWRRSRMNHHYQPFNRALYRRHTSTRVNCSVKFYLPISFSLNCFLQSVYILVVLFCNDTSLDIFFVVFFNRYIYIKISVLIFAMTTLVISYSLFSLGHPLLCGTKVFKLEFHPALFLFYREFRSCKAFQ